MPDDVFAGNLPPPLTAPVTISVRNAELGLNDSGQVVRMDDTALVATLPKSIAAGAVLFATLDLRTLNTTARGLIKVRSQRGFGEGGSEILAEFVELNDDSKRKIDRLLGRVVEDVPPPRPTTFATPPTRTLAGGPGAPQPFFPGGVMPQSGNPVAPVASRRPYFEPAPLRPKAEATRATKFWNSLGVTAYVAFILIVVALFPQGRAFELKVWGTVSYAAQRTWYWGTHVGNVQLWGNRSCWPHCP